MQIEFIAWGVLLAPLLTSFFIGSTSMFLRRTTIAYLSLTGIATSFVLAVILASKVFLEKCQYHINGFTWLTIGKTFALKTGLWIDPLSITLITVVLSISLLVHVYSLAYMQKEAGYGRYFSYLGLFTFSMLTLVGADNGLQLFFGWEAVGLTSYLLIGFWFEKKEATKAAFKAFIVNRIGDIGLLLGLALLLGYVHTTDYQSIFSALPDLKQVSLGVFGYSITLLNVVGILLFIGAMSKSAQIPLQIWLPESMVGPTPVSALMHAATMVTAGVFLIARLSPVFEAAPLARTFILLIGASTALLMGVVALVQTDIKRVIAFSTISQLGYMVAGLGVSAYTASILHLVTHAYFKALLFLSAGSVILSLQHEQSLNKMGGLWRHLPVTYGCFLMGAFALTGLPPFSGFYSKDLILSAVYQSMQNYTLSHVYAFYSLLAGVFITSLYTGRLIFLVFHGPLKLTTNQIIKSRPLNLLIVAPLILLSIPTAGLGFILTNPLSTIWLDRLQHTFLSYTSSQAHSSVVEILSTGLSLTGLLTVWIGYTTWPLLLVKGPIFGKKLYKILASQYGLEKLHQRAVITIIQKIAKQFATIDTLFIDRLFVQGSTQVVKLIAKHVQPLQSGWLHQYLLVMVMSVMLFILGVIIRA